MPYHLFGCDLESTWPLRRPRRVRLSHGDPSRRFVLDRASVLLGEGRAEMLYESPFQQRNGLPVSRLERYEDSEVLYFPPDLAFHLALPRIAAHFRAPVAPELVELRLLGPAFAYVLEKRGWPMLHASVIEVAGGALGILASHGGGKTSLAEALLQIGQGFLADDILALEPRNGRFFAHPAYPWQRMAPETLRHFRDDEPRAFELVHPDSDKRWVPAIRFTKSARPIKALVLPERSPSGKAAIEIEPLSPATALIEVLRNSFTPYIVEATGLQPRRFDLLARLVQSVPVYHLRHPSGFEHLPRIAERLLERV